MNQYRTTEGLSSGAGYGRDYRDSKQQFSVTSGYALDPDPKRTSFTIEDSRTRISTTAIKQNSSWSASVSRPGKSKKYRTKVRFQGHVYPSITELAKELGRSPGAVQGLLVKGFIGPDKLEAVDD